MKISLNWLREYVDITMDVHQLTHRLTMVGLEVDAVQERFAYLDKVVVGHILEIAPHPNADRLRLCKVAAGEHVYEVVCGASNAAENMLVPLALPGTELPSGATVAEGVIRGVRSGGMLCSAAELGLGDDTGGLMALPDGTVAGQPLNQALALSDAVIEIGLTPNRPDCLSFLGIAREVAAIQGLAVQPPLPALPPVQDDIHTLTSVAIEAPEHCPRYA
ncbi:MAG: phenylalanine--tRNA ligase subunit beta, partial [Desulfatitalea sp.]|nr:phenylalanine--tRNA ligase subunit beta [Desulfatitalea sp.]NNK01893.1 phenylalanine--tRNA ligase subunit beta [Desulfatitalea sp.]